MLKDYLIAPSVNSIFFTGIILIIILFLVIKNYKKLLRLDIYHQLIILSLFVIAIGTHGLIHLGLEYVYGLNPYKFF